MLNLFSTFSCERQIAYFLLKIAPTSIHIFWHLWNRQYSSTHSQFFFKTRKINHTKNSAAQSDFRFKIANCAIWSLQSSAAVMHCFEVCHLLLPTLSLLCRRCHPFFESLALVQSTFKPEYVNKRKVLHVQKPSCGGDLTYKGQQIVRFASFLLKYKHYLHLNEATIVYHSM